MLTDLNKKRLKALISDLIKFNNPLLNVLKGLVINIVLGLLDKYVLEKIPDQYEGEVNEVIDLYLTSSFDKANAKAAEVLAEVIPTPLVDGTELEKQVYKGVLTALFAWITKDKNSLKQLKPVKITTSKRKTKAKKA